MNLIGFNLGLQTANSVREKYEEGRCFEERIKTYAKIWGPFLSVNHGNIAYLFTKLFLQTDGSQ